MHQLRARLSYANVMATMAVFIALGGTATAALVITGNNVRNESLTGKDIKNGSIKGVDIRDGNITASDILNGTINTSDVGEGSLNGGDIGDGTLLARDFKPGELPGGLQGPKGDTGATGAKGDTGAPGTDGTDGGAGGTETSTARSDTTDLPVTCGQPYNNGTRVNCTSAPDAVAIASCEAGEQATGGGQDPDIFVSGESTTRVTATGLTRPHPATGSPDAWAVGVGVSWSGPASSPPSTIESMRVYVVCQAG